MLGTIANCCAIICGCIVGLPGNAKDRLFSLLRFHLNILLQWYNVL